MKPSVFIQHSNEMGIGSDPNPVAPIYDNPVNIIHR